MAISTINNGGMGFKLYPLSEYLSTISTTTAATLNAAGESIALIGKVMLEGGSGSKTISSSGGAIYFRHSAITFANGSTNLRIGIQDVNSTTGIEDTTYDVQADLVPGVDSLTGSSLTERILMDSGTKTIGHGDIVAVVIEMTARGGTDTIAVEVRALSDNYGFPYKTVDSGSGPTKSGADMHSIMIEFDDGTFGWILGAPLLCDTTTLSYNSGSTPDEYALIFKLPFPSKISACAITMVVTTGDNPEIILYSDPLGTPSVIETITSDSDIAVGGASLHYYNFTPYNLSANAYYAIAVRPPSASTVVLSAMDFGSSYSALRKMTVLGENWSLGSRANQTGAFSETTYRLPAICPYFIGFDDGASTGGPAHIIGG